MATEVKRRRGTTAQHEGFEGAEAELTVDINKWTVLVHDDSGSAPTGHELLRADFSNIPTSVSFTSDLTVTGEIDATKFSGDLTGAIHVQGKNNSGGTLTKGTPVYISGQVGAGQQFTIGVADADDSAKMPCIGILAADVNANGQGDIVTHGKLIGIDTSSFTVGDELYINSSGTLVSTPPTGESNLLQKIAKVIRVDSTDGQIYIMGAGRTNAVPNLNQNKVFLGDSNNQAVATALSSINLSSFNDDVVSGSYLPLTGGSLTGVLDFNNVSGRAITITADSYLDSRDASIYLGNGTNNYGWDLQYQGTGSGNNNKLRFVSTNSGTPKVAFEATQDGVVNLPQSGATVNGNIILTEADAVIVDGDFTTAGFMKTDGSGTYSVDNSTFLTSVSSSDVTQHIVIGDPATANGGGSLAFTNGEFIFTPAAVPDVSGFITAVNTSTTSGLSGGASSGDVSLTLDASALTADTTLASTDVFIIGQTGATKKIAAYNIDLSLLDNSASLFISDYTVTQADVTQHQAALSITESQISNLQSYLTAHPTISGTRTNQDNSGNSFIQDITFDTNGHVLTVASATASFTDTNYYLNGANWATGTGDLTLNVQGTSNVTINLDGRYLQSLPTHNHDSLYYTKSQVDTFLGNKDDYDHWSISDGSNTGDISSGDFVTFVGTNDASVTYDNSLKKVTIDVQTPAGSNYYLDSITGNGNSSALQFDFAGDPNNLASFTHDFSHNHDDLYYRESEVNTLLNSYLTTSTAASTYVSKAAPAVGGDLDMNDNTITEVESIILANKEGEYFNTTSGRLMFDENFFSDTEYGSASVWTTDGGGLVIRNEDGWGRILSDKNMQYLNASFASVASSGAVTGSNLNVSNWDTAHGWGNHATAGYLTAVPAEFLTQTEGDLRYLQLSGGTLTGSLTVQSVTAISTTAPKFQLKESDTTDENKEILLSGGDFFIRNLNDDGTVPSNENILKISHEGVVTLLAQGTTTAENLNALFQDGNGVLKRRTLGSLAYSSATYDNYGSWTIADDGSATTTQIGSGNTLNIVGGTGINAVLTSSNTLTISSTITDTDTNTFVNTASFNTGDGVLTLTKNDSSTVTADLDGRYLQLSGGTITSGSSIGLTINHNNFAQGLVIHRNDSANAPSITFKNNTGQAGILYVTQADGALRWRPSTTTEANIVFHDGYHPNADALTTSRTISLSNNASGSVSFNGSSDVSISTSLVPITIDSNDNANSLSDGIYGFTNDAPSNVPDDYGMLFQFTENREQQLLQTYRGSANQVSLYGRRKTGGTWDTSWTQYFSDHYHPNADTLTTAREITLGGDLTGSAFFDGSADITISAQVSNNSHTHDDRYLQLSGGTLTGDLKINLNTNAQGNFVDNIGEVGSGNFCLQVSNSAESALKPLGFRAEKFIFATGNVGIGTDSPVANAKLTNMGNMTFGIAGNGSNTSGRFISIEGNTDSAGEGSGRIFFSEHNSSTGAMSNYGMSIGYRGGGTSIVGADGNTWTGLGSIANGEWGMWGHDNNATGALIMHGDRAATFTNMSTRLGINTDPDASFKLDVNGAGRFVNDLYADEDLVVANNIYLTDTSTAITEGSGNAIRHQTNSGWIDIGPQNTSFAHIYTDRPAFYFNKTDLRANNNTIWHAGNDGSGSGLDADTLDGQHASAFLTSYTETDPVFSASAASNIATSDINNWNNAYNNTISGVSFDTSTGIVTVSGQQGNYNTVTLDGRYYTESESDSRFVNVTGDSMSGNLTISGTLSATVKSFNIKHPTRKGKRLVYGVLEGNEHAVFYRGRSQSKVIDLPEEWVGLVDPDSITVQLTAIGNAKTYYFKECKNNKIYIGSSGINWKYDYFYIVHATRVDVKPLQTVQDAN